MMKDAACYFLFLGWICVQADAIQLKEGGKQTWGYVQVRPGANMFWWLYYTTAESDYTQRPLVIWLQGGPGASSTGFGNFEEIGPQDHNLHNRTHNWVNHVNVLFIDNPVGCGFSYVNDTKLLTTNNSQIATDLLEMLTRFLEKVPEFQTIPLYIFSESYGGKMAAQFGLKLWKQIEKKKIKCDFKGVNLGDSWISPVDSVLTWAPFLFSTSLVDNGGYAAVNKSAYEVKAAIDKGQFKKSTALWDQTEAVIGKYTNGVNVYNILQPVNNEGIKGSSVKDYHHPNSVENREESPSVEEIVESFFHKAAKTFGDSKKEVNSKRIIGANYLSQFHSDPLSTLMNGKVKEMLRIIPENVVWGGQSQLVFNALEEDFMKPVIQVVENLLNNTPVEVNVYSGQLDLIVDTMGTLKWVEGMNWSGIPGWKEATRMPVSLNNSTEMFYKTFKNFGFYWVLKAGHMVPADAPGTAVEMLRLITKLKN